MGLFQNIVKNLEGVGCGQLESTLEVTECLLLRVAIMPTDFLGCFTMGQFQKVLKYAIIVTIHLAFAQPICFAELMQTICMIFETKDFIALLVEKNTDSICIQNALQWEKKTATLNLPKTMFSTLGDLRLKTLAQKGFRRFMEWEFLPSAASFVG